MRMTNIITFTLILLLGLFIIVGPADARIKNFMETEFQSSAGYTDNLLADSSGVEDSYGKARLTARIYPISSMEVILNGEYTNYSSFVELTNQCGGMEINVIPLKESSALSLYLHGKIDSRGYREHFESFNTQTYIGLASLGYTISPTMQLRTGFSFTTTNYLKIQSVDNTNYEFFGGIYTSFWGKNGLDLELGYAFMDLDYWEKDKWISRLDINGVRVTFIDPEDPAYKPPTDGQLNSIYISPRYSRQISDKLAAILTYSYRKFGDLGEIAVAGVSTQSLSPWASVYEGESVTAKLKTFYLPNFIIESGVGYWKKDFLTTNEVRASDVYPHFQILPRHDERNAAFFTIKRPFPFKSGWYMEPAITLNYTHNNSSNEQYDYNNFAVSGGITFRY